MREIYNTTWYTPKEIARLGLITNRAGAKGTLNGNYAFILRLIKSGRLKARTNSPGVRKHYLVPEDAIALYHATISKIGGLKDVDGQHPQG